MASVPGPFGSSPPPPPPPRPRPSRGAPSGEGEGGRSAPALVAALAAALVVALSEGVLFAEPGSAPPAPKPPPAKGPLVLHVGDSFVDAGLRQALGPALASVGSRYLAVAKTGSYLGTWADGATLRELLHAHQPALVLVTLGASEVNADPPSIRRASVRGVVDQLKGRPCVWISFPLWKGAKTGLSDLIRRESAPCRHYDSQPLAPSISRQRDGVHPDAKGGAVWGAAVATWLVAQRDPKAPPWGLVPAPANEHR